MSLSPETSRSPKRLIPPTSLPALACLLALILQLFATPLVAEGPAEDPAKRLAELESRVESEPQPENWLLLAEARRDAFQLEPALQAYAQALAIDPTPRSARGMATYLLALGRFERTQAILDAALDEHPDDGELCELRAELAAAMEQPEDAVIWLEHAWAQGRDRLAWLERGRLAERLFQQPYRRLLNGDLLLADLGDQPPTVVWKRLEWSAETMEPRHAAMLTAFLSTSEDAQSLRLGVRALRSLGEEARPWIASLLDAASPRARRAAMLEMQRHRDNVWLDHLRDYVDLEADPGNFDLAQVLITLLEADMLAAGSALERLEDLPAQNTFRHLTLLAQADLWQKRGEVERAAELRREAAGRPISNAAEAARLESYWQCQERHDLQEIRALLEHHRRFEPIDGRLYGLPERDFEDQKNLTVPERLFLRARARQHGEELPTSGPMQYHRESRNLLRRLQQRTGGWIDCAGHLQSGEETAMIKALVEDGTEVKLEEDNDADNEVHIVVNPYDPRHVVATSNPTDNGGNEVYRSSDWGQSWTNGRANVANNCCDPVSYYNRTEVSGQMRDVLYHSTLVETNGGSLRSRVIYSTDNGAAWQDCGTNIGNSDRDRQDHAIDTNPASACYNTLYLGHHDGTQYVAASTGTSFPYCQSWKEVSTGVGATLGSAIVVNTNGRAHNFFTQHGSPGGIYQVTTSNCGQSWSTAERIATIKNAGTFEWGIPSTCQRQVYRYPQADSDRQAQSTLRNNIYIVWNDLSGNCSAPGCSGNTTCNNDVYLAIGTPNDRSNPTSWTFTSRNLTDALSDDYTDEFYPSLTVDQADGAIYISYYRSNSGAPGGSANLSPRQRQVHYVMLRSIDGGTTWQNPLQITDQPTDESGNGANLAMQWGDYAWNDVVDGVAYGSWTDRREGADEDVWASKICSEPSHWSERAPTFSAPATQATDNGDGTFSVGWSLPDLYWGDGGENPAERKFQLWVDGQLATDNLTASSTSVQWSPPDAAAHQLQVRAVNACAVQKTYAAVTVQGDGGGGNAAPQVTILQPSNGASFTAGTSVALNGNATDAEDGDLTSSIGWSSSLDGALGTGGSVSSVLSEGMHTLTAQVGDSGGKSASAMITVHIVATCSGGLSETFEGGTSGWTTSGLWHLAQNSSCAPPGYASASRAMYFGRDGNCDYDTGQTATGDLTSPAITSLDATSTLTFSFFRQVEDEPTFSADRTEVAVSTDGGASWMPLWSKDSGAASENAWTTSGAISLAAYAGQTIRLRFRFNSVDDISNDFVGWLVDDIEISGSCSAAPSIFADSFESGVLDAWSGQMP